MKLIRTERGWGGHFCAAHRCYFRRNTLLVCNDIKIVVSTVGLLDAKDEELEFYPIGHNRHYETMAFHSNREDERYHDVDVKRQIEFDSDWAIAELDSDDKANDMHETVVTEISEKLLKGDKFKCED